MRQGEDDSPVRTWRHAFAILATLELGRVPPWPGPEDFEELKLRVEALALLLAIVPRTDLDRLGEVVSHISHTYPVGSTPALADVRTGVRRLLSEMRALPPLDRDLHFRRATAVVARNGVAVGLPAEVPVARSGDRQEDYDLCRIGMGAWFTQVSEDPKWANVRVVASDEAEASIDEVFVDVFAVPDGDLEASPDIESERVRREAGRIMGETHAVIDVATMVARTSTFCVVVGGPGSGKSTLVQWITRKVVAEPAASGTIADFEAALAVKLGPFALALAEEAELTLLEHFFDALGTKVDDWSGAANWLRNAAREGARYLLLLDGWDEVPTALQDEVRRRVDHERPFFTIITTSRPSGFPRRLATGRHAEVYHIAGLTRDGRRALAGRYLRAAGREAILPELLRQIEGSSDLQELACNPFMLALLTRASASGGLSPTTEYTLAGLYRLAAGWVIDVAAERNPGHRVRLSQSLGGLGRLSHALLFEEVLPRYVFSAEELTRELDAAEADAVVESRFVTRVDRLGHQFAFLHATFEEYFAARHSESLGGPALHRLLDRAFWSATRGIVLEFVVGFSSEAGRECRARLDRWMEDCDRYGQVVFRVARLLAACPAGRRPPALARSIQTDLWERIAGTREMDVKELGVRLLARLDPVALCRAVRAEGKPDQFVLDCITTAIPPAVGISERIAELMDPAMRERVEAELWGGRSPEEIEANRQTLADPSANDDRVRDAVLFAGAARDAQAVSALVARLRTPGLPEELQHEVATSLGLIGGKEAGQALIDLVTGDIQASRVAAGLARRSLQHTEGGRWRLDPVGRDALLRRLACVPAHQPRSLLMLSALQGFPVRAGTRLLKHLAISSAVPSSVRLGYLEALEASLTDSELDDLLRRLGGEGAEIEAMLLAAAVQRRRPVPVAWLSGRLRTSARLPDKQMLLTVAVAMSSQRGQGSRDVDDLLAETARYALSSAYEHHADLAGAFRSALTDIPVDHARPPLWVDPELCRRVLNAFASRAEDVSAEQVMLAATLLSRVPARESGEVLCRCLGGCRDRLDPAPAEIQVAHIAEVARAVARAIADLDPQSLLAFPIEWEPIEEVLHTLSSRRGWAVFDDRILDREGEPLLPPWEARSDRPDEMGEESAEHGRDDSVKRKCKTWRGRAESLDQESEPVLSRLNGGVPPAKSNPTGRAQEVIKVLLLSANPIDSPLNIDEEFRAIDQKIRSSEHRDHVDLVKHGAVRLEDVASLLMRHRPHVVHFSGHGAPTGVALTGPDGKGRQVPPDALANIFGALKDNVRVVLLNACYSAPQAKAVVGEIDCAVGMSDQIEDEAAIAFAAAFYEALGYGQSVQTAFDLALVQLEGAGADRTLAKLHYRRKVKPSGIILVNPPRRSANTDAIAGGRPEGAGGASGQVASLGDLNRPQATPHGPASVGVEKPRPDLVLVTVNEHETKAVHDAFLHVTGTEGVPVPLEGRLYHNLGVINGTTVYHAISEMGSSGPGAMQQAVDKAIRALDPGAVIAVGIAFGASEKTQCIGDILLSKQIQLYELQRAGTEIILRGDRAHATPRLINHFEAFNQVRWKGANVRPGLILSGEKLIDDKDYRDQLLAQQVEAVGGEMEGTGLYVASADHKVDWIVIKAICDWADGNKKVNKKQRQKKAAKNAAAFVVESLRHAPLKRLDVRAEGPQRPR